MLEEEEHGATDGHMGIVVEDLEQTIEFFRELGSSWKGEPWTRTGSATSADPADSSSGSPKSSVERQASGSQHRR
jgi:hypothetical protein